MQPSNHTPQRKPTKFVDTKVLIATLSLAVTLGMWNLFSHNAVQVEKADPNAVTAPPPQSAVDGAPLPTLVPLITVTVPQAGAAAPASSANPVTIDKGTSSQSAPLRSVTAPSLVIVQKNAPLVDAPVVAASGGGGGGGRTVTTTKTSRK